MELNWKESRKKISVFLVLSQSIYENYSGPQEAVYFFTLNLVSVLRRMRNVPHLGS